MSDLPPFTHKAAMGLHTACEDVIFALRLRLERLAHLGFYASTSARDADRELFDTLQAALIAAEHEQPADAEGENYIEVSLADYNQKTAEILALRKQVEELTKERDELRPHIRCTPLTECAGCVELKKQVAEREESRRYWGNRWDGLKAEYDRFRKSIQEAAHA